MKTVILAGGYGTRIRDVAQDIPKPMIPIGGRPILWHIMGWYARHGVKDFVLPLGYKGDVIKDYFLHYHRREGDFTLQLGTGNLTSHQKKNPHDWTITFVETGMHAMTGARLYRVKQHLEKDDCFMLTYGDGVSDIDIRKLMDFHRKHGKIATVTGAHPSGRFGELELDGNKVAGFNEKPQATAGWISAGFFVFSRKFLDYLTPCEDLVLEKEPLNQLVSNGQLMVFKHEEFWHPMDTSRDHQLLNQLWDTGNAPWKI